MSVKRILLLGANGQLGRAVKKVAKASGVEVVGLTRNEFDADTDDVLEVLSEYDEITHLVNCIAYHKVDQCEDNFEQSMQINAELVMNLAKFCAGRQIALVHISTDYVFDGLKQEPYTEEDLRGPLNVYGVSKCAGELLASAYCPQHFIVRVSSLFGDASASAPSVNFVEKMIVAAREERPLRVIDDQIMSPTFTEDAARAILFLVTSESAASGIYHACNEGETSWHDFAQEIFSQTGLTNRLTPVRYTEFHTHAPRPQFCSMSIEKLKGIGFAARPWQEGLRDYLNSRGFPGV